MQKIVTENAPKAIGPYSQGVSINVFGKLLFVSGQFPIDNKTQELIKGDMYDLTNKAIDNMEAILVAGGSSLSHVLKVDIFLTNLKRDFNEMNRAYALHFTGHLPPARQTVQVSDLPLSAPIEISCIAYMETEE